MKIIAAIEDPPVIRKILEHLGLPSKPPSAFPARGPPQSADDDSQQFPDLDHTRWSLPPLKAQLRSRPSCAQGPAALKAQLRSSPAQLIKISLEKPKKLAQSSDKAPKSMLKGGMQAIRHDNYETQIARNPTLFFLSS